MQQVACPSCGRTNQVPDGMDLSKTRCSSCGDWLPGTVEQQWWIRQGANVQGPFQEESLLEWVTSGRVRVDMEFSSDGNTWRQGQDCPELFPDGGVEEIAEYPAAPSYVQGRAPEPQSAVPAAPQPADPYGYPEQDPYDYEDQYGAPGQAPVRGGARRRGAHAGRSRRGGRGGRGGRARHRMRPHRGGAVLTLGILGLVLCAVCGIIAWVMGNTDLREMRAGRMDPSGEGMTQAGRICGMISTILLIIGVAIWFLMFASLCTATTYSTY